MAATKITVNSNGSIRVEGDFEIVDPLARAQLRNQPARLLATAGPGLCRLIRIAIFRGYRRVRPAP